MTLPQQFRISCFALTLSLYIILGIAHAEQLTIAQDPGVIGEPISFVATGELDLDASDGVAEFIVDFSPKFLSNPLGDTPAYSSFRSVSWGNGQDISGITITEYVSDGADQVVPIADFEPVTLTATGYTAGDVPFPAPFPFELRQFGVRIEGLQGGPIVSFEKDAMTNGRGGGQVVPEPSSCLAAIFGIVGLTGFRQRTRSGRALRAKGGPAADSRQ